MFRLREHTPNDGYCYIIIQFIILLNDGIKLAENLN